MAMNEKVKQKRIVLGKLSIQAKEIRKGQVNKAMEKGNTNIAMYWASRTLNSIIIEVFYKKDGNTEFKTFKEWKEEGKKIIKGSKGFVIWGRPIGTQKAEEGKETDEEEINYFPISHLFSNKQVEPAS